MPNDSEFPIEVAQDLLAISRALYALYSSYGRPFDAQVLKLRGIGAQLHLAIQRASESKPGTFKHRAAWIITEDAIRELGELIGEVKGSALVAATGDRLARKRR